MNEQENGTRRYGGRWAGDNVGTLEDTSRCIQSVFHVFHGKYVRRQCARRRGHGPGGLYCSQHGRKAEQAAERTAPAERGAKRTP